jgi:hypothetical protein
LGRTRKGVQERRDLVGAARRVVQPGQMTTSRNHREGRIRQHPLNLQARPDGPEGIVLTPDQQRRRADPPQIVRAYPDRALRPRNLLAVSIKDKLENS